MAPPQGGRYFFGATILIGPPNFEKRISNRAGDLEAVVDDRRDLALDEDWRAVLLDPDIEVVVRARCIPVTYTNGRVGLEVMEPVLVDRFDADVGEVSGGSE